MTAKTTTNSIKDQAINPTTRMDTSKTTRTDIIKTTRTDIIKTTRTDIIKTTRTDIIKITRIYSNKTTKGTSDPEKTIKETTHRKETTNQTIHKNCAENAEKQTTTPTNAVHNKIDISTAFKLINGDQLQLHRRTLKLILDYQTWQI